MTTRVIQAETPRRAKQPWLLRAARARAGGLNLAHAVPIGLLVLTPSLVMAEEAINSGDTAWMLTATALVLFMTIPGLALFYAGMVRSKNVLSVLMQCFAITALMSILWTF